MTSSSGGDLLRRRSRDYGIVFSLIIEERDPRLKFFHTMRDINCHFKCGFLRHALLLVFSTFFAFSLLFRYVELFAKVCEHVEELFTNVPRDEIRQIWSESNIDVANHL